MARGGFGARGSLCLALVGHVRSGTAVQVGVSEGAGPQLGPVGVL